MKTVALYAGSFDPITLGHLDIIERATKLFDSIIVTVAVNHRKEALFSGDERINLIKESIKPYPWADSVNVEKFEGLLVDFAKKRNATALIRGARRVSDFEYEFQMALTNRRLAPNIDTVFLMPDEKYTFTSATIVREIAAWEGELESFVPKNVVAALRKKYAGK